MVTELLAPYRGRADIKIDELVSLAAVIIPRLTGPQAWHRVTGVPDARTIRYYIQQGLVDRPHASAGTAALYAYRHLLQLVAIKVLQGHFLPIRAIRPAIGGLDDRQLEERLEAWLAGPLPRSREAWASWNPRWHSESLGEVEMISPTLETQAPTLTRDLRAPDALLQCALKPPDDWTAPGAGADQPRGEGRWLRVELHPGIELHIREGTRVPASRSFLHALASRLCAILDRYVRR
ncbi:MAG: MerR family transcriptional regulator [Gemmatimonadota bacterium]